MNARGTDHSVVFLQAGLIESEQLDWFSDPERVSYLEAPTSYYHFNAPILPIPFLSTPASDAFVKAEVAGSRPISIGSTSCPDTRATRSAITSTG